jgi:hypothetical protein
MSHPRLLCLGFGALLPALGQAATPRFMTSAEEVDSADVFKPESPFSVALNIFSNVPSASPFEANDGGTVRAFRFQASGALGLELNYRWSPSLDVGVSAAYEGFETRLDASEGSTEFRTGRLTSFPFMATARWRFGQGLWAPEVGGGLGMAVHNISITSTNLSDKKIVDSSLSPLAQVTAGLAVAWTEEATLGVHVGYRYSMLGTTEANAGTYDVSYGGGSGLLGQASLRYAF